MTPCKCIFFSKNGSSILKNLVLITFFVKHLTDNIFYTYIYSVHLIVITSLKYSIRRAKYINITNGWFKQQDNSSTLL